MPGIDSYTKLMLHMDGADGSTTFTDSEITPKTVSVFGDAQIDTAQSKFGGASGLFDGTGDYLSLANSTDFEFGLGDFTIDFWARIPTNPASSGYGGVITTDANNGTGTEWELWFANNRDFRLSKATAATEILGYPGTSITADVWHHYAIVRSGTGASDLVLYFDGTSVDTASGNITLDSDGAGVNIGRILTSFDGHYLTGHLDELRVSKGVARWTANFTPPSSAYSEDAPVSTGKSSTLGISGIIQ